jgi:hypothetical protein
VREDALPERCGRIVVTLAENDVRTEGECLRPHKARGPLGNRPRMQPHRRQIVTQVVLELRTQGIGQGSSRLLNGSANRR